MVEGEDADEINEEINTQPPIVLGGRSKNDRLQESPLPKSQRLLKRQQLKPSDHHTRHRDTPRGKLNRNRTPEVQGRTPGTKLYNRIEKILKGVPRD